MLLDRDKGVEVMIEWGQLITLCMLAIALGMDAFSLGLALGMQGLPWARKVYISTLVGFFHMWMPLLGICIGHYLSYAMRGAAAFIGGGMLLFLGGKMLWHSKDDEHNHHSFGHVVLLAFSVSIDSLSAGLSLGLFASDQWLSVMAIGLAGTLLTIIGLSLGEWTGSWLGNYGEIIGGIILILLGMKFIW